MPYNYHHIAYLATPRTPHPLHIPSKASVYWMDYLLDDRPHKITNPDKLREYYEVERRRLGLKRVDQLAKPKPWPQEQYGRSTTAYGIPISALHYVPSERILRLATPVPRRERESDPDPDPVPLSLNLPPINERYLIGSDDYWVIPTSATSIPTTPSTAGGLLAIPAPDFSHGDFRSRSRYRKGGNSVGSTTTLPPIESQTSKMKRNRPSTQRKRSSMVRLPPIGRESVHYI